MTYHKFSPIDREFSIFEFYLDGKSIFDVSYTDDGKPEIAFHEGISGLVMDKELLLQYIEEGFKLANMERDLF